MTAFERDSVGSCLLGLTPDQLSFRETAARFAASVLALQYVPERLPVMSELPRTPSGKIQKFKLRDFVKTPTNVR